MGISVGVRRRRGPFDGVFDRVTQRSDLIIRDDLLKDVEAVGLEIGEDVRV